MTLSKGQKWLSVVGLAMGLGANVGVYVHIPKRMDKLEAVSSGDHDVLIEMKTEVRVIKERLSTLGFAEKSNNSNKQLNYNDQYEDDYRINAVRAN